MNVSFKKGKTQESLWERYVGGDKSAFGELYSFYHKSLTAYCIGSLKSIELAENAASETLIKLLQHPNPQEIESFENWLFVVSKNICNTYWAKNNRRNRILEMRKDETDNSQQPEVDRKFSADDIQKLLTDHLSPQDFEIWQLHQQGYKNDEISEILGISEKTIANRKSMARNKLKEIFKHYAKFGK